MGRKAGVSHPQNCLHCQKARLPHTVEHTAKISRALRGRRHAKSCGHCEWFRTNKSYIGKIQSINVKRKLATLTSEEMRRRVAPMLQKDVIARAAKTRKMQLAEDPELVARRVKQMLRIRHPTKLEKSLHLLLCEAGLEFSVNYCIGRRFVDAYVSSLRIAFEADGHYYHQDPIAEKERDDELLCSPLVVAVVHLTESDLAPWRARI